MNPGQKWFLILSNASLRLWVQQPRLGLINEPLNEDAHIFSTVKLNFSSTELSWACVSCTCSIILQLLILGTIHTYQNRVTHHQADSTGDFYHLHICQSPIFGFHKRLHLWYHIYHQVLDRQNLIYWQTEEMDVSSIVGCLGNRKYLYWFIERIFPIIVRHCCHHQ